MSTIRIHSVLRHPNTCRRYGWQEVKDCVVSEGELALTVRLACGHEDRFTVPYMGFVCESSVADLFEHLDAHPKPCTCESGGARD